jgi:hypothetical protein
MTQAQFQIRRASMPVAVECGWPNGYFHPSLLAFGSDLFAKKSFGLMLIALCGNYLNIRNLILCQAGSRIITGDILFF